MSAQPLVLFTLAISHYCESVRWLLDLKAAPYVERSWAPMLHMTRTFRRTRTYTPLLRTADGVLQESRDIALYVEAQFAQPEMLPGAWRDEILAIDDAARSIGAPVRRITYHRLGAHPPTVKAGWAVNLGRVEGVLHSALFPVTRPMVYRALSINDSEAARSTDKLRAWLADNAALFATPGKPLVGDRFTLADLTTAAMLSPLVFPPEHPVYGPLRDRPAVGKLLDEFQDEPASAWVRACYAQHRGLAALAAA